MASMEVSSTTLLRRTSCRASRSTSEDEEPATPASEEEDSLGALSVRTLSVMLEGGDMPCEFSARTRNLKELIVINNSFEL